MRVQTHLIDITENDLLYRLVLKNLPRDTAITAANNEHLLGVRVARKRDVRDHLLVANLHHKRKCEITAVRTHENSSRSVH